MSVLMTGLPGFLGSSLLPRILERGDDEAVCVVQRQFVETAHRRVAELGAVDPQLPPRVRVIEGDITQPGLGVDRQALVGVTEAWHLAAVYDLTIPRDIAHRVNVAGTRNLLNALERCPDLSRLHHISTCYVSGRYAGPFSEDDLEVGAPFNNFYEESKHLAEAEVRRRMSEGMPATIYRPSIVMGDSRTGETQKYDGPYFVMQWLLRQPRRAFLPVVGDPDTVRVNVVPRDFVVDALIHLSGLAASAGRTYHVADPQPLTVTQLIAALADATCRDVTSIPLPRKWAKAAIRHVPGVYRLLRMPAEAVDYFAHPTFYLTDNLRADLAGSGVQPPPFLSYVDRLVAFMRAHPDIGSTAMY